jgi:hypothetical protein
VQFIDGHIVDRGGLPSCQAEVMDLFGEDDGVVRRLIERLEADRLESRKHPYPKLDDGIPPANFVITVVGEANVRSIMGEKKGD